jgi:hypothetical protein
MKQTEEDTVSHLISCVTMCRSRLCKYIISQCSEDASVRSNTYEIGQDSHRKIEVGNKRPTKRGGGWKGRAFS